MRVRIPTFQLVSTTAVTYATLLIEGLWVYLWMALLGKWDAIKLGGVPLNLVSILFLLWASYYTVRLAGRQDENQTRAQLIAGGVSTLLILLVARLENGGGYSLWDMAWAGYAASNLINGFPTAIQVSLMGGLYLWWRGFRLAGSGFHQEQVFHSFVVGLVGIVIGIVMWEAAIRSGRGFDAGHGEALAITVTFFVVGLGALAISHLTNVRATIAQLEGADAPLSSRWSLVLTWVVLGMLAAGGVVTLLLSFDIWPWVGRGLSILSYGLSYIVYYAMLPLAYLVSLIVYGIQWLMNRRNGDPVKLQLPDFSGIRPAQEQTASPGEYMWVTVLKWAIVVLIAALAIYLLARMLSRRRKSDTSQTLTDIHESVGTWRDMVQDLLIGLILMFFWFQRKGRRIREAMRLQQTPRTEDPDYEMDVRALYGRLLAEGRSAGFPRREHETPSEYLATLERRLPAERESLERITQGYMRVRYGEQDPAEEEVGLLNRLWRKTRDVIRGLTR